MRINGHQQYHIPSGLQKIPSIAHMSAYHGDDLPDIEESPETSEFIINKKHLLQSPPQFFYFYPILSVKTVKIYYFKFYVIF